MASELSTSRGQRMVIWIIAIVMMVGTLGSFFLFMLPAASTPVKTQAELDYAKQLEEYKKQQAEADRICPSTSVKPIAKVDPVPVPPELTATEQITEVRTEDVVVGDGAEVKAGDCVELFYHGVLASDAKAFQGGDNYATGEAYRSLTSGFVQGFSKGLVGMKVGGERKVFIPAAEGYGERSQGEIPANSDLIFAIKVVGIYVAQ